MVRLVLSIALAALTVLSVLSLDARLAGVRADDLVACTKGNGDTQLRGCSRIIKSRRLYGKPISKKNLSIIHYKRGRAYNNKKQYDRAIADYDKAIKLNPKFASAYNGRGVTYDDKGQYDRAIAEYTHAIKLNPQYIKAYNNRAWAYFKWGKAAKGLPDANKAIELDPKYAYAYGTRGHIYEALDRKDEAIADLQKALELNPSIEVNKEALKRLGVTP